MYNVYVYCMSKVNSIVDTKHSENICFYAYMTIAI